MTEPVVYFCTIIDGEVAECAMADDNLRSNGYEDRKITDMIGYVCTSPTFYAELKSHHQILHRELNKKVK